MRERNPLYIITPRIELLLRKRNKLRTAGRVEHADNLTVKINRCIGRYRISALAGAKNEAALGIAQTNRALGVKKQGTGG